MTAEGKDLAPLPSALRLSCGCLDDAFVIDEDPTLPPFEVGEAVFCNLHESHGLVDILEVVYADADS